MVERMRILRSHLRKVTATYTRTRRAAILRRAGAVAAAVSLLVTSPGIAPVAAQDAGRSALASVKPDALDAITQPAMGGGLTAASAAVVPPPGIVSWWTGDGTVTDLMDRNPGRFVGPVAYATGAVGAGFAFPGKDAALVVPDDGPDTGLGLTGDFTIDAWVFRTANQRGEQFLAGKAAAYSLSLDEGRAKATVVSDTLFSYDAVSSTVIPLNTWTHLAAVYDRAEGHLSIYVNGEVENLVNTGGAAVVINQNPFNIGGMLALGGSLKPARFYQGRMDEVDLYNRPLTVGEVRATVAAGAAGKDKRRPGLAGWWEAEGDAADFSGRHPGRLEGSAGYAPGKVGQAFSFGGRDGAVTVPATADNRLLGLTGSFTLDAWVYRSTNQSGIQWIAGKAKSYFLTLENAKVRAGFAVGPAMVSVLGATEIPAETWTHVAAVYDQRAGELQVFVNGVPDGAQNGLEGAPLAGDQPFTLGGLTAGGGSHLNGRIDEAGAYDRALTAEQIAAIAAAGSAGKIKPLTGLLNWWTADNFGRELLDGLPGRSVGGVLYTGGVSGAAFRFNGKDSAVVTPSAAGGSNLDVTADFTLDAWVFRSSDQAGRQWVAGRHQSYWLSLADGKVVGGFFHGDKDKQAIFLTSEKAIPVGVWTHLTLTYDRAAGLLRLYVNATSAGEAATDHVAVALSAFPFGIGAIVTTEDGAKPGQLLDGRVDEVDIYGRALSPAEVAASYVAEQSDKRRISAAPGAVRWWRGEGEVSDAQVGQPASAVGDVSFSEGKVGRAMYFNGVGSTVAVAADEKNSPYDIDSDFTLEGWVLRTVEQTGLRLIAGKQNTYHLSLMNGKLRTGFGYGAPPVYDLVGNTVIPVGVWTHIAAT
ncbi:MAG: LamG domain-containing protein, partial [Chloroflexi bacterium]|nr:LamG domain-containing protein [Chloroflexota bacterium]